MNSLCEEPFIEIIGDTIGDRYNVIVRQQPFNKQSIEDILPTAITINSDLILNFDARKETEYYTSFQLDVSTILNGVSNPLAYLPIIYSPQTAKYFGNRRFSISDNYVWSPDMAGKDSASYISNMNEKILNDLLLVIESYSVLPFTRTGTLRMHGDRRIKKGTWVILGEEIYYVDSVNNVFECGSKIDRVTILSLKRGMVINNITGDAKFNYFNIFKTKEIKEDIRRYLNGSKKLKDGSTFTFSYGVNEDVFDYFFRNEQFIKYSKATKQRYGA